MKLYCNVCGGILGTHVKFFHQLDILKNVEFFKRQYNDKWAMFIDKNKLKIQITKWK